MVPSPLGGMATLSSPLVLHTRPCVGSEPTGWDGDSALPIPSSVFHYVPSPLGGMATLCFYTGSVFFSGQGFQAHRVGWRQEEVRKAEFLIL